MGAKASARYRVSATDPFMQGHFPGGLVVPGAVLLRFVEQTLAAAGQRMGGIERVKFLRAVLPGETVDVVLEPVPAARGQLTLSVNGENVAVGTWLSTPN